MFTRVTRSPSNQRGGHAVAFQGKATEVRMGGVFGDAT